MYRKSIRFNCLAAVLVLGLSVLHCGRSDLDTLPTVQGVVPPVEGPHFPFRFSLCFAGLQTLSVDNDGIVTLDSSRVRHYAKIDENGKDMLLELFRSSAYLGALGAASPYVGYRICTELSSYVYVSHAHDPGFMFSPVTVETLPSGVFDLLQTVNQMAMQMFGSEWQALELADRPDI